ncbi:unnamed protein product [Lampetra planeri]
MPARRRRHDGSTRRTGIPLSQVPRLAVHNNPLAKRRANMPRLHSASGNRHLDSMRHHQRSRDGDARAQRLHAELVASLHLRSGRAIGHVPSIGCPTDSV